MIDKSEGCSAKKEIINAFLKLMTEKDYADITVTDIVEKAGVARVSFYRNFNSTNDIAQEIANSIFDGLVMDVFPVLHSKDDRKWREFLFNNFYLFLKWRNELEKFSFNNISVIFTRIDNKMQEADAALQNQTLQDKYMVAGKIGLINNITKKWLDSGEKETPEEMVDYIMSFITAF